MAIEYQIIASEDGQHYLLFGMDQEDLTSFGVQLWITKYGARIVDWIQAIGMSYITFMGGDLYVHNSDTAPRANLFGEQKDVKMGIVMNEESGTIKLMDSLGIFSDGEWEVESLTIPATLNRPHGMYSVLPRERFKKDNDVLRAEFLRNMKTNSATATVRDAISGEELKGHEAYLVLKNVNNSAGEQVKLFKVEINLTKIRG